jgi:hypothetical protein
VLAAPFLVATWIQVGRPPQPEPTEDESMIADEPTSATVAEEIADAERIGCWGLSMSAVFGIPLVTVELRIKVAALSLGGLSEQRRDGTQ